MTLTDAIRKAKCRQGKSVGITSQGAYWLAHDPQGININRDGGDGIGQSAANITICLELRHYRNGKIKAVVIQQAWHQNGSYSGGGDSYHNVDQILKAESIEDVIAGLKQRIGDDYSDFVPYSDDYDDRLASVLTDLGLPIALAAPDEN